MQTLRLLILGLFISCFALSAPAFAQNNETPAESESEAEIDEDEDEDEEETRESEDGSYEWKPSYGGGLEAGLWFNGLDRWNAQLLRINELEEFDVFGLWHFDLFIEASLIENTRLSIFGGYQTPFSSDPSASAFYLGIEPAFAFRRDMWEVAVGAGVGFGATSLGYDSTSAEMDASLIVVRPFVEVRRYVNTWMGVYGRFGFNQWLVDSPEFEDMAFPVNIGDPSGRQADDDNLNEGGAYIALGIRFGHYPEHIRRIPDTDGDGILDDVDECPEDPEDFDGFEDEDGCPDLDNDGDGIPDSEDECPNTPGIPEMDGCPEKDTDGDGIPDHLDECPDEPEDFDEFEDEDGCPDPDNDGDGILDAQDKCPDTPGVPEKDGCPFENVQVTLEKIEIQEKVFFDLDKATIKEESFQLLTEVAQTMNAFDRIRKIEVQGHTDTAGAEDYNQDLSQRRAESVREFLIDNGVEPDRLTAVGYGESKLLVPVPEDQEETPEVAAQNRRVEFVILEQEEVTKTVREDQIPDEAAKLERDAEADDAETDDAEADDAEADDAEDDESGDGPSEEDSETADPESTDSDE